MAENSALPDNDLWTNRVEVKSETSNRVYIVAQHKEKRHFACSCMGWKRHRSCKHLTALGLPNHERPHELEVKVKKSFTEGYKTYEPEKEGYGNASQWQQEFSQRIGLQQANSILKGQDPYAVLGLSSTATWQEIEKAYREKTTLRRKRRNIARSNSNEETTETDLKLVQAAYEVLEEKRGQNG